MLWSLGACQWKVVAAKGLLERLAVCPLFCFPTPFGMPFTDTSLFVTGVPKEPVAYHLYFQTLKPFSICSLSWILHCSSTTLTSPADKLTIILCSSCILLLS